MVVDNLARHIIEWYLQLLSLLKSSISYLMSSDDLHPIELTAHTLLSGSLDNLNDNFEILNQSQLILLTRLKFIEERLLSFKNVALDQSGIDDKEVVKNFDKIKELQKRLTGVGKVLEKVEERVERIEQLVEDEDESSSLIG